MTSRGSRGGRTDSEECYAVYYHSYLLCIIL